MSRLAECLQVVEDELIQNGFSEIVMRWLVGEDHKLHL